MTDLDYVVERHDDPVYWVRAEGHQRSASALYRTLDEARDRAQVLADERGLTMFVMRDAGLVARVHVFHPGGGGIPCTGIAHPW